MNSQTPIACDLSAIKDDELVRHRRNGQAIFEAINEIWETPDGYRFQLPAETGILEKAGAFIARERLCCPFFQFRLTIPPEKQEARLELSGREGVKSYIEKYLLPRLDAPVINHN